METYVRNFIRSSLIWLAVGFLLGLSMALWPADHLVYRPAHAHSVLAGFVLMMIFGVGYHVMPRFNARPLESRPMARLHLWIHNVGLVLMVSGWLLRPTLYRTGQISLQVGGVVLSVGLGMFIYNIWKTLGVPPERARTARHMDGPGQLPVNDHD